MTKTNETGWKERYHELLSTFNINQTELSPNEVRLDSAVEAFIEREIAAAEQRGWKRGVQEEAVGCDDHTRAAYEDGRIATLKELYGSFQPFLARYSLDRPIPPSELRHFLDIVLLLSTSDKEVCAECQVEGGDHSQACSKYVEDL